MIRRCASCTMEYEYSTSGPDRPENDRAQCPACKTLSLAAEALKQGARDKLLASGVVLSGARLRRTAPSELPHRSQRRRT